jgi:hypothetical protein
MIARSLPLAAILIVTLATACACPSPTTRALRNGSYRIDNEIIQLTEAEHRQAYADDSAMERVVRLAEIVEQGDLDGRDGKDAVVVLVDDGGGSGTFYHLAVLLRRDGTLENVATQLLGDRILIQSVAIDDATHGITVHALVREEGAPMSAEPEVQVTMLYLVIDDRISPVRRSVSSPVDTTR